jgi:hypothetical protein
MGPFGLASVGPLAATLDRRHLNPLLILVDIEQDAIVADPTTERMWQVD